LNKLKTYFTKHTGRHQVIISRTRKFADNLFLIISDVCVRLFQRPPMMFDRQRPNPVGTKSTRLAPRLRHVHLVLTEIVHTLDLHVNVAAVRHILVALLTMVVMAEMVDSRLAASL
jgi:hypothetical protein